METIDINKITHELMKKFDEATSLKNNDHLKCSIFYLNEDNNIMYAFNKKDIPQNSKVVMIYTLPQIMTSDRKFKNSLYFGNYDHMYKIFKTMVFYSLQQK